MVQRDGNGQEATNVIAGLHGGVTACDLSNILLTSLFTNIKHISHASQIKTKKTKAWYDGVALSVKGSISSHSK